jgi:HAD superfamily hydrolase (TIGR01509 family)
LSVVTQTLPAAVLWDMDGTLVDTEPYWMQAEDELVSAWGGQWSHEDALTLVGAGLWHSARVLQGRGVQLTEDEIVDHLTDRVLEQIETIGTPWRAGARELLAELRGAGVKTALVTMSVRRMAEHVAGQLGFNGFDTVVSGDDVTHAKPHPEPYLVAAERLGVDPADCIAIEDSAPGTASAVAAGAVVIAVPFVLPLPESDDYTLWESLAGRTIGDLRALLAPVTS